VKAPAADPVKPSPKLRALPPAAAEVPGQAPAPAPAAAVGGLPENAPAPEPAAEPLPLRPFTEAPTIEQLPAPPPAEEPAAEQPAADSPPLVADSQATSAPTAPTGSALPTSAAPAPPGVRYVPGCPGLACVIPDLLVSGSDPARTRSSPRGPCLLSEARLGRSSNLDWVLFTGCQTFSQVAQTFGVLDTYIRAAQVCMCRKKRATPPSAM
jgi:hypothetical protein